MEISMTAYVSTSNLKISESQWVLGGILLVLWFSAIVALAISGSFAFLPGVVPIMTLSAILGPPLLFALVLFSFPSFKAWALSLDPALLTALQGWRVLGGGFLMLYAFGHLPGFFAFPAGIGDVAVGIGAPFTAMALARGHLSLASNKFLAVHISGLIDFIVAVGTGIIARQHIPGQVEGVTSSAMGDLPLVLIPTFGVPIFIILHLIVLVQIWEARQEYRVPVTANA
jgi:hypothetical protein